MRHKVRSLQQNGEISAISPMRYLMTSLAFGSWKLGLYVLSKVLSSTYKQIATVLYLPNSQRNYHNYHISHTQR